MERPVAPAGFAAAAMAQQYDTGAAADDFFLKLKLKIKF
jgi:hypothetical protein